MRWASPPPHSTRSRQDPDGKQPAQETAARSPTTWTRTMNPTEATSISSPAPSPPPPASAPTSAAGGAPPSPRRRWFRRGAWAIALLASTAIGLVLLTRWVNYRLGHSVTDDAFVEAHIVSVAP